MQFTFNATSHMHVTRRGRRFWTADAYFDNDVSLLFTIFSSIFRYVCLYIILHAWYPCSVPYAYLARYLAHAYTRMAHPIRTWAAHTGVRAIFLDPYAYGLPIQVWREIVGSPVCVFVAIRVYDICISISGANTEVQLQSVVKISKLS